MKSLKTVSKATLKCIKRFVRLPTHKEVAECAKRVWKTPSCIPDEPEADGLTALIFRLDFRADFERLYPDIYRSLFARKDEAWKSALREAYQQRTAGKSKSTRQRVDSALFNLFYEALLILNKNTEGLDGDFTAFKSPNADEYRLATHRKRGKLHDPALDDRAIRLCKRHEMLMPKVGEVHRFVQNLKQDGIKDERLLRQRVETKFTQDWIKFIINDCAFEALLPDAAHDRLMTNNSIAGKWAPWQLTVSIIRCEENERNNVLGLRTISRDIGRGRKIRPAR